MVSFSGLFLFHVQLALVGVSLSDRRACLSSSTELSFKGFKSILYIYFSFLSLEDRIKMFSSPENINS